MPSQRDRDAEDFVLNILQEHFSAIACERSQGLTYDCIMTLPHGGKILCELKTDWKARVTGNLYFETKNTWQGKDSGLIATTASCWAHYVPHKHCIFLVDPKALLWYLTVHEQDFNSPIQQTLAHGGDNNSQGWKVPIAFLENRTWIQKILLPGKDIDTKGENSAG